MQLLPANDGALATSWDDWSQLHWLPEKPLVSPPVPPPPDACGLDDDGGIRARFLDRCLA